MIITALLGPTVSALVRARHLALSVALVPSLLALDAAPRAAFDSGERLVYAARAGRGLNGRAEMWIGESVDVRGVRTIPLHSDIAGGFGPLRMWDRTTSWFDPSRSASLRFVKEERNPFGGRHSEDIEIDAHARSWKAVDGRNGVTQSDQPLDELSFIYALRTMSIPEDSTIVLNRHYDADRNPTTLRSLGRSSVETPAGTFATREIEMRVRDARRYRGEGVIRISLSDDVCRRPVRIESKIPNAGNVVMTLTSAEPVIAECSGKETTR